MNKTKVDDMLIEMIAPKLKEIEEKFSGGGALTQDDINTLLLKSQYNHINHLDTKLNEVVGSVFALEQKFTHLEQNFNHLEKNFNHLEQKLSSDMANLEQKLSSDMANLEQKVSSDIANLDQKLSSDMANLEQKVSSDIANLDQKLSSDIANLEQKIEATIQKALNKNMMTLIVVIGAFLTLSKIIDKF
jgi:predicted  nucleic acid-binding Zn-ribbon protein